MFLDILASLQGLFVGYIPAAVLGSFIGYLIGMNSMVYQLFRLIFQIPHSIPPIALLPIALIVFQESESAATTVVFLGTLWTMIINTAIGIRHFHRQNKNFRVAIFHLFHALKASIWVAWFIVIAIEMLTGPKGLGFTLWEAYKAGNIDYIIQVIIYIGIIGFLLDQLLDFAAYILSEMVSDEKKSS
jgi:ABC-type nitrate/sulfonate/bicarbonate transport system permease component